MKLFIHSLKLRYELFKFNLSIWWNDLKDESRRKYSPARKIEAQKDVKKEKMTRGIRSMLKAIRDNPEKWKQPDADVMQAVAPAIKTQQEIQEEMEIRRRLISETKLETEEGMADTFVKNQPLYKLKARRQKLHRQVRQANNDGNEVAAKEYAAELQQVRLEIAKLEGK